MRHIITFSLCLFLIQPLSAEPELKGSPAELTAYLGSLPKTVEVTGESEVKVQADRAIIGLKVTTENRSLQEALRANQEVRNKILNSLKDHDIGADRIQASKFSSTPKYGMFGDRIGRFSRETNGRYADTGRRQRLLFRRSGRERFSVRRTLFYGARVR